MTVEHNHRITFNVLFRFYTKLYQKIEETEICKNVKSFIAVTDLGQQREANVFKRLKQEYYYVHKLSIF